MTSNFHPTTVSQLISKLQKILQEEGDLEIAVPLVDASNVSVGPFRECQFLELEPIEDPSQGGIPGKRLCLLV